MRGVVWFIGSVALMTVACGGSAESTSSGVSNLGEADDEPGNSSIASGTLDTVVAHQPYKTLGGDCDGCVSFVDTLTVEASGDFKIERCEAINEPTDCTTQLEGSARIQNADGKSTLLLVASKTTSRSLELMRTSGTAIPILAGTDKGKAVTFYGKDHPDLNF